MKAGWKTVKLGEIAEIYNGNTISDEEKKRLIVHPNEGLAFIATKDVGFDGVINYENGINIPKAEAGEFKVARNNAVLVCAEGGSAGRKIGHVDRDVHFGNKLFALNASTAVHPRYLYHFCLSEEFRKKFKGMMAGLIGGVSIAKFKLIEIPLPPLAEQKRIVALLDDAFAGIEEAKAKAEETRTAYSKMFDAQVELTFSDNRDWSEATLNDLGQTLTGTTPPTANPEYYGDYIPFIKPADFNEDGTLVTDNHGLSKEGEKVARVTNPDSVLMVCIGATIGKSGYTTKRITTNQQINSFIPGPLVNFKFAYYQMISSSFQKAVLSRANQATMPMISKSKWNEIPLKFPGSLSAQTKLAERLHDLRALTGQLAGRANLKIEALNEIKASLLAQAFTGELTA